MEQQNVQQTTNVQPVGLEQKIDKLQKSINSLNTMFKITLIVTVILFVLPLLGLLVVIPQFISTFSQYSDLLK